MNSNEKYDALRRCVAGLQGAKIRKAIRSVGSFILLYFILEENHSDLSLNDGRSILVSLSNWIFEIEDVGAIDQDSSADIIDQFLPHAVGMRVSSVAFQPCAELDINFEGGSFCLRLTLDSLPDDEAWTFYNDREGVAVEAWTVTNDNGVSYWKADSRASS